MNKKNLNDYELLCLMRENNDFEKIIYEKYKPLFNKHINKYLPITRKVGIEYDDLLQQCYLTLYNVINSYDINKECSFYTYLDHCIKNNLITLTRRKCNNKYKDALYNYLSYDMEIRNTDIQYIDFFEDTSITNMIDHLSLQEEVIRLKNSMEFDISCVFELYYNGYNKKEIAKLLNIGYPIINKYMAIIKNKILYT